MAETVAQIERLKKGIKDGFAFVGVFVLLIMGILVPLTRPGDAWVEFLSSSGFFNGLLRLALSLFLLGALWGSLTTLVEALESRGTIAHLSRMLHDCEGELRKSRGN